MTQLDARSKGMTWLSAASHDRAWCQSADDSRDDLGDESAFPVQ